MRSCRSVETTNKTPEVEAPVVRVPRSATGVVCFHQGVRVIEYLPGFIERNTVLVAVAGRLNVVPFESAIQQGYCLPVFS